MPSSEQSTPAPPRIDLTQVTEETRRRVYDATVAVHFLLPHGTVQWAPYYDPDQAGLTVYYLLGRWFVAWAILEETNNASLSPARKHELLRVHEAPEHPTRSRE
jgi:hypothetical protein